MPRFTASSTASTPRMTRWQALRHPSNPPSRQIQTILSVAVLVLLYSYALLGLQPDRSGERIVSWNLELERKARQLQQERQLRRRRVDSVLNRTQALAQNGTNVTSSVPVLHKKRKDPSPIADFLVTVAVLAVALASWVMCHVLWFYSRPRRSQDAILRSWVSSLRQQRPHGMPLHAMHHFVLRNERTRREMEELMLRMQRQPDPNPEDEHRAATRHEIEQCPTRQLHDGDDLLRKECSICLESFCSLQIVRTIPCFHSFHTDCIDPWLLEKAICPVCKHPVVE